MITTRQDIIQKIANLRALSEGNTAENEAMNAIARAERLMHSYRIEEAEIAMAEASGEVVFDIIEESTKPLKQGRRNRHKVHMCLYEIKKFTDTECVISTYDQSVSFTGDRPDVELAIYLSEMIQEEMEKEYTRWRRTQPNVGRGAKNSFQMSMAHQINRRLEALREEHTPLPENHVRSELTSTALVVSSINQEKRHKVAGEFKAKYPRLRASSGFRYGRTGSASAGEAGREAGNKVSFGRPLERANTKSIAAE